jgi:hypothetical protein
MVWVKPPAMLMRDRLLSNYSVRPAVSRLKTALLGLAGALVASVVALAALPPPPSAADAFAPSAAPLAGAAPPPPARDYEATLREFEPWALEEGGEARPGGSVLDHMRTTGGGR